MKNPNAQNVGKLERGSSSSSVTRPLSSLALKFKTLADFLASEALTNFSPTAARLLLEFTPQLAGKVA